MVNWVELIENHVLRTAVKLAGLRQQTVEIEPGTVMTFWVPKETISQPAITLGGSHAKKKKKKKKPAVVLVHGFAADGIMSWTFQVMALASTYSVYVPDLPFFGASTTRRPDRSPAFVVRCLAAALGRLGVARCTLVGFSYGGMLAIRMAWTFPDLVRAVVVTGAVANMTRSMSVEHLGRLGFKDEVELLLPNSVAALRQQLDMSTYKNLMVPDFLVRDFLEMMCKNRKERADLLKESIIRDEDARKPNLAQRVYLLWGACDGIFNLEVAESQRKELGDRATLHTIEKAGHLAHVERPIAYNRRLKEILALIHA